jgi:hypothetical protein
MAGRADALIFIHAGFRHIQQRWIIRCQLARTIATITESGNSGTLTRKYSCRN